MTRRWREAPRNENLDPAHSAMARAGVYGAAAPDTAYVRRDGSGGESASSVASATAPGRVSSVTGRASWVPTDDVKPPKLVPRRKFQQGRSRMPAASSSSLGCAPNGAYAELSISVIMRSSGLCGLLQPS